MRLGPDISWGYRGIMVLFLGMSLLSGCGSRGAGGASSQTTTIQIRGSDTEVNLVQRLAEEFMKQHPQIGVAVTGGGSGTGIAALMNKTVDIANSSREMKAEELRQARDRGVDPVRLVFAMDGLSVIVNSSNSVESLTLGQIGRIFRGEIKNWRGVGGPDLPISLYGRQNNSGTYVFFRDFVLRGEYSERMKAMNGNAQIVETVKGDPGGIGYVGSGYTVDGKGRVVEGIKVLNVAPREGARAISPLKLENIMDGTYPITRPLNQYVDGEPEGAVKAFIRFELSRDGQAIVRGEGFYPVSPDFARANGEALRSR